MRETVLPFPSKNIGRKSFANVSPLLLLRDVNKLSLHHIECTINHRKDGLEFTLLKLVFSVQRQLRGLFKTGIKR